MLTDQTIHEEAEYLLQLTKRLVPREQIAANIRLDVLDPNIVSEIQEDILAAQAQDGMDPEHLELLEAMLTGCSDPLPEDFTEEEIENVCLSFFQDWVSIIYNALDYLGGEAALDVYLGPTVLYGDEGELLMGVDSWAWLAKGLPFDDLELVSFKSEFTARVKASLPLKLVRGIILEEAGTGCVARGLVQHVPRIGDSGEIV